MKEKILSVLLVAIAVTQIAVASAYTPIYTDADIAGMGGDIFGTAFAKVLVFIGVIILALIYKLITDALGLNQHY